MPLQIWLEPLYVLTMEKSQLWMMSKWIFIDKSYLLTYFN